MIKLSPLNAFERIQLPFGNKNLFNSHKKIVIEDKINGWAKQDDCDNKVCKLRCKFFNQWNKELYVLVKNSLSNVDMSKLEHKPANRYMQFGHYKVYGGMRLWIVRDSEMVARENIQCNDYDITAQVEYIATVNPKEVYICV